MMKEGNKIILLHSIILGAMQISLSAGKNWFLFLKFHLYAVLMLVPLIFLFQNTEYSTTEFQIHIIHEWLSFFSLRISSATQLGGFVVAGESVVL